MARTASTSAPGLGVLEVAGQVGQRHQRDARQVDHRRVDVVGQGEVDQGQRTGRGRDGLAAEQDAGGAGAGDDEVGVGDLGVEVAQRRPAGVVLTGEALGPLRRAVDHDDLAGPTAYDGRDGEAGHAAGADDDDAAPSEVVGRPVEGGGDERRRRAVDAGLGVGALADAQGLLEQGVEGRAHRAQLLAAAERVAGLAEDLGLADGHRVEPGRDLEQVGDGAVVVVDVEVGQQRLDALVGRGQQALREVLDAAVEAVDGGVDLEPVAGRDHGRLGDVGVGQHVLDQLVGAVAVDREPLEQRDRRGAVGDADDEDRHAVASWAALRCSW